MKAYVYKGEEFTRGLPDGFFRVLDEQESEQFAAFALKNNPASANQASVSHPVCFAVWLERGVIEDTGMEVA